MPNQLGIYDMTGNVAEWCWDRYWDWYSIKLDSLNENYTGPNESSGVIKRAICGAFYGNSEIRSKFYDYQELSSPFVKAENFGFRIVKNTSY